MLGPAPGTPRAAANGRRPGGLLRPAGLPEPVLMARAPSGPRPISCHAVGTRSFCPHVPVRGSTSYPASTWTCIKKDSRSESHELLRQGRGEGHFAAAWPGPRPTAPPSARNRRAQLRAARARPPRAAGSRDGGRVCSPENTQT